ncbi:MAG: Ala-tRNA(Pro) hydrolase [Steroidobacteraceae bacterium]|nr:Ala-tRNA(Pro) hydrolase [Steroidobacteraceae bacterium]
MTEWLFQQDAYLERCAARVLEASPDGVVLDRTVFYPLGGGQPGDTGVLEANDGRRWTVVDARKGDGGRILHRLADGSALPGPADEVEAIVDWPRRHLHMRMHTGLHLLGSVLRFGVTGGQVAADRSRLDFDTQDEIDAARVNEALQVLVEADRPVSCRWITDEELDAQPELVRTLSVQPPRGAGRIRLLEIAGVDLQPCGGTHVRSTGEVGRLVVTKVENKGRHNKRVYVAFT